MAKMKDYQVIKNADIRKMVRGHVDTETVSAMNIDNLRKNLSKRLSKFESYVVYANDGRFLGVLGRMGRKTITWKTKDGKSHRSTWPEMVWMADNKQYACSEKDGTIRRI